MTPTLPISTTQHRAAWSKELRDAEFWIAAARKEAKSRRYDKSRSAVLMACFMLDNACLRDIEGTRNG